MALCFSTAVWSTSLDTSGCLGLPVPKHVEKAVELFRYNRKVFIAPPWEEIFEQDRERKQDFTEAVRTYETMVSTYIDKGYRLVELPRGSVEERVTFVIKAIGNGAAAISAEAKRALQ